MEITKTFYARNRAEWRQWLQENYDKEPEIWLVYYLKASGKPRVAYDDAVEEALCFGWIDSTAKKLDEESTVQKFSPRKPKSFWSELNKERARKLIANGLMTEAGLRKLGSVLEEGFEFPADILEALKADPQTWENFSRFPESYRRIRVAFVADARKRPDVFAQRLAYLLKMTALNKQYGTKV
ncbi:YdeI/OmpD-associated family protein [Larkinella soli]|uniref:YdeI/OmpD-associated family protein n=1 Tax=Larkinella soli TaxID=1770527 RepID=UPI000FFC4254|nr:YdeI/OmpD-associated family protein [Larkinella soli]